MQENSTVSFGLSSEQLLQFAETGYLHLPGMINPVLLEKLRRFFETEMKDSRNPARKVVYENKGQQYVTNLEELCAAADTACLELLGSPFITTIARTICGEDFFPIQEFAVIKNRGDELPVLWHRDMLHEGKGRCFTMGIYLDNADENDGALQIIPGSHLDKRELCTVCKDRQQQVIQAPMKAGDVLIHDMMLAHCSAPLHRNPVRRVIYFEFLSAAHVAAEQIYSAGLVQRRTKVMQLAQQYHLPLSHGDLSVLPALQLQLQPLYEELIRARPSAYCFEQTVN